MKYNLLNVFTDGGARGNPGESAVGVYIVDEKGNQVAALGKKIGIATNNVAEYMGVLEALSFIIENKKSLEEIERINFFLHCKSLIPLLYPKNMLPVPTIIHHSRFFLFLVRYNFVITKL